MQIYRNKRKSLHKKRVQLPQDWFGTPTWPPFHCFGTPIWPPWGHVKTLHTTFIGFESFYKGTNNEQRPSLTYKQSQLQRKVPGRYHGNERYRSWQDERDSKGLQELRNRSSQCVEADVTLTEADKPNLPHALVDQDRLLLVKKMFANAGEKGKKRRKSLKWNNMIVNWFARGGK